MYSARELRESPLYEQLYQSRSRMTPVERKRNRNVIPAVKLIYPLTIEREYSRWINKHLIEFTGEVNKYVLANYATWAREYVMDHSYHTDGFGDVMTWLRSKASAVFRSFSKVSAFGEKVRKGNTKQWDNLIKTSTGLDMTLYNPDAQRFVQKWATNNTEYLKELPHEYVGVLNNIISRGLANNKTRSEISAEIYKASKKFKGVLGGNSSQQQNRADRIARDQVGKLKSALARSDMKQAKIDVYEWLTAGDERVRGNPFGKYPGARPSHYIMDRMYKQVDDSSKISKDGKTWRSVRGKEERKHPGEAINCRCLQIASFIALTNQVDKDINRSLRW